MDQDQAIQPGGEFGLADLDLEQDDVTHALLRGNAEARTVTAFDPSNLGGTLMWARTASGLRERLVPRGWGMDELVGVPRTIHPSGTFAVVVNTGDMGTGHAALHVSTKHPRGAVGVQAVQVNIQLSLFSDEPDRPDDAIPTWILLVNCTPTTIFSELSLPNGINGSGRITSWQHRIFIDPIQLDQVNVDDGDEGPDFDVSVVRR